MELLTKRMITKHGLSMYLNGIKLQSKLSSNNRYVANDQKFAGVSTSVADYAPKELPVHYFHPPRKYVKSEEKAEYFTTQGSDYQAWKTEVPKRWKREVSTAKGQYSVLNIGQH
jgi:hypothetical protein